MSHNPDRPDRVLAAFAWLLGAGAMIAAAITLLRLSPFLLSYVPGAWVIVVSLLDAGDGSPVVPLTTMESLAASIGLGAAAMALHVRAMGAGWLALKHGPSARGALPMTPMAAAVFSVAWGTCLAVVVMGAVDIALGLAASRFEHLYLGTSGLGGTLVVALLGSVLLAGLAWALEHRPFVVIDGLAALRPLKRARSAAAQKQN